MNKYKRLGKNTLLVIIGNMGSKLISLFMLPFYTKWLSVAEFGIADLLTIYVLLLTNVITCSIAEAIFIFPKGQGVDKQRSYFSTGLFFTVFSFLIAAILFYLLQNILLTNKINNTFTEYTWIIYFMVFASFIQNFIQQFSRSIDEIKVYAFSGILLTAFTAILSFLLIPKYGLLGYIFAQILSSLLAASLSFIFIKGYRYITIRPKLSVYGREMLVYSIPLIPNTIVGWLISAVNRPMIESSLGIEAVGIYAVANRFPAIMMMLSTIFMYSWQISVIEEFNKDGYKVFYNRIFRVIFCSLILVSIFMTVLSEPLVVLMADKKYYEAWQYIPFLCLGMIFFSIAGFVGTNFSAVRKSKYYFYSSVWGAVTSVVLNWLLIPKFGLWGAVFATLFAFVAMALSRIFYSSRYVSISRIYSYLLMIAINVIVILSVLYVENVYYKYSIVVVSLIVLYLMNISSVNQLYFMLKEYLHKMKG